MELPEPVQAPRYGPLWARAVLRPFAEQVLAALTIGPGETVVDLSDDDGTTAELLRRRGLVVVRVPGGPGTPGAAPRGVDRAGAVVAVRGGMDTPPSALGLYAVGAVPSKQSLLCSWLSAPHEDALRQAFGLEPLVPAPATGRRWPDVVRFDTVDHLWVAALARADVSRRAAAMSTPQLNAARRLLQRLVSDHLAADAGLRIPVAMAVR